jgi:recombinational DNA repair protein RecR
MSRRDVGECDACGAAARSEFCDACADRVDDASKAFAVTTAE